MHNVQWRNFILLYYYYDYYRGEGIDQSTLRASFFPHCCLFVARSMYTYMLKWTKHLPDVSAGGDECAIGEDALPNLRVSFRCKMTNVLSKPSCDHLIPYIHAISGAL